MHTQSFIHTLTNANINIYIHITYKYTTFYTYILVQTNTCVRSNTHTYIHTYILIHTFIMTKACAQSSSWLSYVVRRGILTFFWMYSYIHTYIHTHTTHTCSYILILIEANFFNYVYSIMCTNSHTYIHTYIHTSIHTDTYIHTYTHHHKTIYTIIIIIIIILRRCILTLFWRSLLAPCSTK